MENDTLFLYTHRGVSVGFVNVVSGKFVAKQSANSCSEFDSALRIIDLANKDGIEAINSLETEGKIVECRHRVFVDDKDSKNSLLALRDMINAASWQLPRCFASFLQPLEDAEREMNPASHMIFCTSNTSSSYSVRQEYDYDVNIPTFNVPSDARYLSIKGANFNGFAIRYGVNISKMYDKENLKTDIASMKVG